MILKPKRFGPVQVRLDGQGAVSFALSETDPGQPHPPGDKPVLTLMASVGHCLVESIRIVAARQGQVLAPFAITVRAEKSLDLPGRLQSLKCTVSGPVLADPQAVPAIIAESKTICTISNTLNAEVTLERAD